MAEEPIARRAENEEGNDNDNGNSTPSSLKRPRREEIRAALGAIQAIPRIPGILINFVCGASPSGRCAAKLSAPERATARH